MGVPGEGLNVEQRKRLTIGVELAAKPQLLLFLDEVCFCQLITKDVTDDPSSQPVVLILRPHGVWFLLLHHKESYLIFLRFQLFVI